MTSIKGLQRILRKRLPAINRWGAVHVYTYDSPRLPWWIDAPQRLKGTGFIVWTRPKRKNIHDYEHKAFPLEDLEKLVERNRMRLRNQTKAYK